MIAGSGANCRPSVLWVACSMLASCAARTSAPPAHGPTTSVAISETRAGRVVGASPPRVVVSRAVGPDASTGGSVATSATTGAAEGGNGMAIAAATDGAHPDGRSATTVAPSGASLPRGVVVPLSVPGFDPALVSFPGAPGPSPPLIVVAHGAKDLPDAQCKLWRAVAGDAPVLLCLAGPRADVKIEPRYFPDHRTLEQIVVASVTALGSAYPSVDTKAAIYAGYSQGATMGALILGAHAGELPRLALVEGGFDGWTVAGAAAFKSRGGDRVLFACGTGRCLEHAAISARSFRAAGVEAKVVSNLAEGHAYGPRMEQLLRGAFDWLTANDARYSSRKAATDGDAWSDARRDRPIVSRCRPE